MGIVVTIPKSEYNNIDAEIEWAKGLSKKDLATKNWTFSRLPTKISINDRCYFYNE